MAAETHRSKDQYIEPNIFYRYEKGASSACQIIGIAGVIVSVTLSNIFFFDLYNCENLQKTYTTTIAIFFGYDWYYIFDEDCKMGISQYTTLILIQMVNLYNNGSLVVATLTKNKWYSINWSLFSAVLLIQKCVSTYLHIKNQDVTCCFYILGSIIYLIIMMICLIILFFAQLAWTKDDDEEIPKTPKRKSVSDIENDAGTPYEPNFNYYSF